MMSALRAEVEAVMERIHREMNLGHVDPERLETVYLLEHDISVPLEDAVDAQGRRRDIERALDRPVTEVELCDMFVSYGLVDVRRTRRRVEDFLRKKASEAEIVEMARDLGLPIY
jgi:hypothetical protein